MPDDCDEHPEPEDSNSHDQTKQGTSLKLSPTRVREIFRLYKIYRDYVTHEDVLINQRLQRMLIIQGFIFAATGALLSRFGDALATSASASNQMLIGEWWSRVTPTLVYGMFLLLMTSTGA